MPVIAQAELLTGPELLPQGKRRRELQRLYEAMLRECTSILPVTSAVAEQFASIVAQLRRDGQPIETNDIWIAAIAIASDLTLASNDRHFEYVDGLELEDWTAA
jgi:tRNA(fMet)-specific endonuclease VapC